MNKTLHKKLTEKHFLEHTPGMVYVRGDYMPTVFVHEMRLLHEAAADLLSPRPEAVSRLLELAKNI